MTTKLLHFRFLGGKGVFGDKVETVDKCLSQQALTAFPESILAKLAETYWKSEDNASAGNTRDNPIVTKPLESPCKIGWHHKLAAFIVQAYEWKLNQDLNNHDSDNSILYFPRGVELEGVSNVLDYYGITIDLNENEQVSLDKVSVATQVRYCLYQEEEALMKLARDFIFLELKRNPKRKTLFIFADSTKGMACLNKLNAGNPNFVRVGGQSCDAFYEFSQNDNTLRVQLVQLLKAEGLEAEFLRRRYVDESECSIRNRHNPGDAHNSLIAIDHIDYTEDRENDVQPEPDDPTYNAEFLPVLRVMVPTVRQTFAPH